MLTDDTTTYAVEQATVDSPTLGQWAATVITETGEARDIRGAVYRQTPALTRFPPAGNACAFTPA